MTTNTDFNVTLETVLAISATPTVNLAINPSSDELVTGNLVVDVSTNSPLGYTLTMSADDTNLVNNSTTPAATFPTLTSSATSTNFPTNQWGYSITGSDSFLPMPNTYSFEPTTGPEAHSYTYLTLGVKADTAKPAGTYTGVITFSVVANEPEVRTLNIIGLGDIQYEPGMTWGEWLESKYNTVGLTGKQFQIGTTDIFYHPHCIAGSTDDCPNFPPSGYDLYEVADDIEPGSSIVVSSTESEEYTGKCLWHLNAIFDSSVAYRSTRLDQPIEFVATDHSEGGDYPIPTTYVYEEYNRETDIQIITNDASIRASAAVYQTTTWAEWIMENPTVEFYDWENPGDPPILYNTTIINNAINFINSENPNDKYVLSNTQPSDVIMSQEYTLTPTS